jgi:hypothetical protein
VGCDTDTVENDRLGWDGEMSEKDMLDMEMLENDMLLLVVVVSLALILIWRLPSTPGSVGHVLRQAWRVLGLT